MIKSYVTLIFFDEDNSCYGKKVIFVTVYVFSEIIINFYLYKMSIF